MPPSSLSPARPTIVVRGQASDALTAGLVSLAIHETLDGVSQCEATFTNWGGAGAPGFLFFDRRLLDFGAALEVTLRSLKRPLFDGRIVAIEGGFPAGAAPTVTVRAEDRFLDLRTTRRTRTFRDASDADVVSRIAGDHGLTAMVDVAGATHRALAQLNQSDLSFLHDRARATDADLWLEGTTLHMAQRRQGRGGGSSLALGSSLREFVVGADLRGQRTSVSVCGWNVAGKQQFESVATDAAIARELGGRDSGASILASEFGAREETLAGGALTVDEARAEAESAFVVNARRFVVGRGVADAGAGLRAGTQVTITGVGPLFSGAFDVTECTWLFDATAGLRTEFLAQAAGLGRP